MERSNYCWAIPTIEGLGLVVRIIAEIGSRDALDGVFLAERFSAEVDIFEPDPLNIVTCKENVSSSQQIIRFHDFALSNKDETIAFYSIDPAKYNNPGAGGLFKINFANRGPNDPDFSRECVQRQVSVQARRFDSLGTPPPDLIAMDVQGAELLVLEGFGELLKNVKAIIFEASFSENYVGGCTFEEIDLFLRSKGFNYLISDRFGKARPQQSFIKRLLRRRQAEFNCLYVNQGEGIGIA